MPDLKTTLGHVKTFNPCRPSYDKFINHIGTDADNTEVKLSQVFDVCGTQDALWLTRVWDYKEYCLLCADIAESVLHLFEEKYPKDLRPRKAIEEIRLYYYGYSSIPEMENAAVDAYAADAYAYAAAAAADADADAAADAAAAAADAAYAYDAYSDAYSAADAYAADAYAADADAYAAGDAYSGAAGAAAYVKQWEITEQLLKTFIKSQK